MRIPINWLSEFVKLPKSQKDLTDKLTMAGHMLDKIDTVNKNTVLDLELRGNRADCYSIIGIAREVSSLFNTPVKYPKIDFKIKKVKKLQDINLEIKTNLVKRVMMFTVKDVKIIPSPKWLKEKLEEYGIPSINNIVDLTNYVMIETGEPLHAFDLDQITNNLQIRLAKKNEVMTTFLGKTITLDTNDLVWANNDSVLSLAGAIGSKTHSISATTKNILIEGANYDRANIRRTIHKYNLLTDAGIRHEKELDPNLVEMGIIRFLNLLEKNKWGVVTHEVYDHYPKPQKPWKLTLNYQYLNSFSGIEIDKKTVTKILKSLNFSILKQDKNEIQISVPTYRTDVTLEEDLIEEILRIYGYDKIPTQTLSLEIPKVVTPNYITQELEIKNIMTSLGFDEVISSTFILENYLKKNKPITVMDNFKYSPVKVLNRPSQDNEFLRMSLYPNLLMFTRKILNERGTQSLLFEIGKIYLKDKKNYLEKRKLGIIYYQKDGEFVQFKGFLESLFEKLNIDNTIYQDSEKGYKILVGKETVGRGKEHENTHYVEIDLDSILEKSGKPKVRLWPKYPPQIEDLTLTFPPRTRIGEIIAQIKTQPQIVNIELVDIYKDSYTFRIWYQNPNKTLTDKEVEKIRNKILKEVSLKFGGVIKN